MSKRLVLAAVTAIGLAAASSAHAYLTWSVTVNGQDACAVDQDAFVCSHGTQVLDQDPAPNSLGIPTTLVGGVLFDGSLANAVNGPPSAILSSSNILINNTAATTALVTMAIGATDYSPTAVNASTAASGVFSFSDVIGSTITVNWYDDPANSQGAETPADRPGNQVDTFTFMATQPIDIFAHAGGGAVSDPAPFSMTLGIDFDLPPDASLLALELSLVKEIVVVANVAEPSAVTLIALALVVLGFQYRRRKL